MIKHIVMFNLKDSAEGLSKAENQKIIKERLEALNGKIDGLLHLEVAYQFINGDAPCDLMLYSEFTDEVALKGYAVHPLHVEVAEYIGKVRTTRALMDYTV